MSAITTQAKETLQLVESIHSLHYQVHKKYETFKSPYISRVIDFLFEAPIITIPMIQERLSLKVRLTVDRLINQLQADRVITEIENEKGPRGAKLYAFFDLLRIIQ